MLYGSFIHHPLCTVIEYEKNQIIYMEDDLCKSVDIIVSGSVRVERTDVNGFFLSITLLHDKNLLGGNILFSKSPFYPMTITANQNTKLLKIPKSLLIEKLKTHPGLLENFLEQISDNTNILSNKLRLEVKRPLKDCIVSFLQNEYRKQKSLKIKLPCTKKMLAERFGVQRTSLSRTLQDMKKQQWIDYDTRSITVLDPDLLNTYEVFR